MSDSPNVLLILTDQHTANALGCIDESYKTPNIDELAESGILFTQCYTTHPQCSPARSSLITGQYPHQTGMYTLSEWGPGSLNQDCPSVAKQFRLAGYETTYIGKWHLGENNIHDLGWETTKNVHETANPPEGTPVDTTTRDQTVEYISSYKSEKPFFLTVSFNLPHPSFYEDLAFSGWYNRDEIPLPESFDDDLADKPAFHRDRAFGPEGNLTEEEVRGFRYKYRTMISRVDNHIGYIIAELESQNLRENTIIAFTSDHGDMQGAHRLSKKGVIAYDEILQVPLVVDIPDNKSRREQIPDLISIVDIPGSLLEVANVPSKVFEHKNLLHAVERESSPENEAVFFEHKYAYWGEHPYRGVRTTDWKYVEYTSDEINELYHIAEDPSELTNLYRCQEWEKQEVRLQELLNQWWVKTNGDESWWQNSVHI